MGARRRTRQLWWAVAAATTLGACGPKFNPGGSGVSDEPAPSNSNVPTTGGNANVPASTAVTYSGAAGKIITATCATSGCHNGAQPPQLADYSTAKAGFAGGGLSQINSGFMPIGAQKLSAADKATLQKWAAGGYQP